MVECHKVPTDSWVVTHHKQGVQGFMKSQSQMKEVGGQSMEEIKDTLGTPGVHGYNGLLQGVLQLEFKDDMKEKAVL
eukprot:3629495-Karenia_brevis.AAC.1